MQIYNKIVPYVHLQVAIYLTGYWVHGLCIWQTSTIMDNIIQHENWLGYTKIESTLNGSDTATSMMYDYWI